MGASAPFQDVCPEIRSKAFGKLLRYDLRLIVPAPELSHPVQRHRNYRVNILKVRRLSHARAKKIGKPPPGPNVPLILQGLRDTLVGVLIMVIEKGSRECILHLLIWRTYAFQRGVETVCHHVVGLFPRIGEGKVCGAPDAQLLLPCSKLPAAYNALPRQQQICKFTYHVGKYTKGRNCRWKLSA